MLVKAAHMISHTAFMNIDYFNKKLLYIAMSKSTQKSNINFIDTYLQPEIGYI